MITLREQVANAMDVAWRHTEYPLRADGMSLLRELSPAAIGVVLGVVADEIKALPRYNSVGEDWVDPDDALAVVERLRG